MYKNSGSIIIINYYSTGLINQLESALICLGWEIIVVDNSGDFSSKMDCTIIINTPVNLGFGRACNLAAEHAKNDVLIFLNPDILMTDAAVIELRKICEEFPKDTIGGAVLHSPTMAFRTLKRSHTSLLMFERYQPVLSDCAAVFNVEYVSGACMFVSQELWKELGGFDEQIFMYAEDLDLCQRAKGAGCSIKVYKRLELQHLGGKTFNVFGFYGKLRRLIYSLRGHIIFFRKHCKSPICVFLNSIALATGRF